MGMVSLVKPSGEVQLDRANPLARGLIGYWPLTEGAGVLAGDIANRRNGSFTTLTSADWRGTARGAGVLVDAHIEYIQIPDTGDTLLRPTGALSVGAWFLLTGNITGFKAVVAKDLKWGGAYHSWAIRCNNTSGQLIGGISSTDGNTFTNTAAISSVGAGWHLAVLTWVSGDYIRLYVDSAVALSAGALTSIVPYSATYPFTFGNHSHTSLDDRFLSGTLSQVFYWNRQLSAAEVAELRSFPNGLLHIPTERRQWVFWHEYVYGTGTVAGVSAVTGAPTTVNIEQATGTIAGAGSLTGTPTTVNILQETGTVAAAGRVAGSATGYDRTTQPTHARPHDYSHDRSQYAVQQWRVSRGYARPWLLADPPADFITRGIWHGFASEFDHIANAGYTTAVCPTYYAASQEVADLVGPAATYGLKVVPILRADPQTDDVATYDANATVAGWYVYDEPNTDTNWAAELTSFEGYKSSWGAAKPLVVCCSQQYFDEYAERFTAWLTASEIVMHDNYPYKFGLVPRCWTFDVNVGTATILPVAQKIAEANSREHWFVGQAHGAQGALYDPGQPPAEFLRAQAYFALINGATGYCHFALDSAYLRSANLYGIAPQPLTDYGAGGLVISAAQRAEAQTLWNAAVTLNAEVAAAESYWLKRSAMLDLRVDYIPDLWCWSDNPIRYGCRGTGPYLLALCNIENFAHSVRVQLPFTPSSVSRSFGPTETQTGSILTLSLPAWGTWAGIITE